MGLTLDESARRAGANQWIEGRLFEVAGGWVADTPETAARLVLDRHSRHHAWRAQQWWERLPVLADVDREGLCLAPGDGWVAALEHLAAIEQTSGRLAGLYRVVLPRLHARYAAQRADAGPGADASSLRTLGIVGPDLASDWQEGEALLQRLLDSDPGRAEAVGYAFGAAAGVEILLAGHPRA